MLSQSVFSRALRSAIFQHLKKLLIQLIKKFILLIKHILSINNLSQKLLSLASEREQKASSSQKQNKQISNQQVLIWKAKRDTSKRLKKRRKIKELRQRKKNKQIKKNNLHAKMQQDIEEFLQPKQKRGEVQKLKKQNSLPQPFLKILDEKKKKDNFLYFYNQFSVCKNYIQLLSQFQIIFHISFQAQWNSQNQIFFQSPFALDVTIFLAIYLK